MWGTYRGKRPNATLAANSGFDQPSMIALASSRILELGTRLWKGCRRSNRNACFVDGRDLETCDEATDVLDGRFGSLTLTLSHAQRLFAMLINPRTSRSMSLRPR